MGLTPPPSRQPRSRQLVVKGVPLPANALVTGDLHCARCSYNLRGNTVGGRCPECGYGVSSTLIDVTEPALADESLISFGRWYLMLLLAYAVSCLFVPAALFFAFVSAAARLLDLRRVQGNMQGSQLLRERFTAAIVATTLEAACAGGAALLAIAEMYGVGDPRLVDFAALATAGVVVAAFLCNAYLLLGFATRYEAARIRWELYAGMAAAVSVAPAMVWGVAAAGRLGAALGLLPFLLAVWLIWIAGEQLVQVAAFNTSVPEDLLEPMMSALERQEEEEQEAFDPIPLADVEDETSGRS